MTIRVNSHALLPDGGELTDLFGPLERQASREARGLLGASFIQWVAARRSELTDWVDDLESESPYIEAWNRLCAELEHDSGVRGRIARVAMVCTSGWIALLTWLLQTKVLTRAQADGIWDWVIVGLIEQIREQDPSSVDGPRHMLDLLRSALLTGTCHLSNQIGRCAGGDSISDHQGRRCPLRVVATDIGRPEASRKQGSTGTKSSGRPAGIGSGSSPTTRYG